MDGLVLTGISELVTGEAVGARHGGTVGAWPEGAAGPRPGAAVGVWTGPAAVVCAADGTVAWVGRAAELPEGIGGDRVDVGGRAVIPGFVDSHTHLVFAGDRAEEWEARMAGQPYAAGGIRTTVEATRAASDAELTLRTARLAAEALRSGTTTLEVKSGYGLDVHHERRLLQVGATVTTETTWLGAHVVPGEYTSRPDDYVELLCGPMLDACAPFARWADVFCERGAFDGDQARAVLTAARQAGLGLRLHGNQLGPGPGAALAVDLGAASVDHCTYLDDDDIAALAASAGHHDSASAGRDSANGRMTASTDGGGPTVATLLPVAEFATRSSYPDGRRLLDAGVRVALASDCNPGSSFTTSMPLVIALAVREMGFTVYEAIAAATAGGADALRREDVGRLSPGRQGDLVILEAPAASWLGYRPGVDLVRAVVRGGRLVAGNWPDR